MDFTLSQEEEERARELHNRAIVIDVSIKHILYGLGKSVKHPSLAQNPCTYRCCTRIVM